MGWRAPSTTSPQPPRVSKPALTRRPSNGNQQGWHGSRGLLRKRLDALRAEGRYRVFADLERRCGRFPRAFDHRIGAEVLERLSRHGAARRGPRSNAGDTTGGRRRRHGTRNISGNSRVHLLLKHELADLHGREAALIFTSGYVANDAALSTLARELPDMAVFSDACNHASMIAGIRNSRAEKYIFCHNDVHCAACKNATSRRGGGAMNSGPTGSVISSLKMRSISDFAAASSDQPNTSSMGSSWLGWRAPHNADVAP
jgi:Aminotransferase class I and II